MEKHVLGLELPTDPRWTAIAGMNIIDVLVDHAYCEQKAASSCISLIVQYQDKERLVEVLTPVVSEEWNHFAQVLLELKKRGMGLGPQRKDEYVDSLQKLLVKGGSRDQQLIEKLLMNALIEARSCERFRLLSKDLNDEGLRGFYHTLMVSEAGHYKTFLSLAKSYDNPDRVERRWRELLHGEGEIIKSMSVRGDRMH
jgi:tRNA 2-(methylsulfanyl)-N6-isopentenyladenosine37 hydroxylase